MQSVGEKHAWVCSLDENFLGWGCVKVPKKQLQDIELFKYAERSVDAKHPRRKRSRQQTYEATTNAHKVNNVIASARACLLLV